MILSSNSRVLIQCLVTLFLLLNIVQLGAQDVASLDAICERNKLPTSSIHKILQDKEGFLWFGTPNGLARYDGYRTLIFRSNVDTPNLLSSNYIMSLAADRSSNILIGTSKGLDILNRISFEVTHLEHEDVKGKYIRTILVASDESIWIGTSEKLLRFSADLELLSCYSQDEVIDNKMLPSAGINHLYEDRLGNVWILIHDKGIFKYNSGDETFTRFPWLGRLNNPYHIYQDNDNDYWVSTWGSGVYRFDPQFGSYTKFHLYNKKEEESIVFGIVQDIDLNRMWLIGSLGIYAVEKSASGSAEQLEIGSLIKNSNNIFTDIQILNDGNLCIATDGDGVLTLNLENQKIRNYPLGNIKKQYGVGSDVQGLIKCEDNSFVIAQNRLGLCFSDRNFDKVYSFREVSQLKDITDLKDALILHKERETDRVWIGLEYSANIYVISVKDQNIELKDEFILSDIANNSGTPKHFLEDAKGNMWIITDNHVFCKLKDKNLIKVSSFPLTGVTDVTEDSSGRIWLTSDANGIYKVEEQRDIENSFLIENYTQESHQLVSNKLIAICADKDNYLWYSTAEGNLIQYNYVSNAHEDFTRFCGAKGEVIQDITIDRHENFWLSTCNRIIQYNPYLSALKEYSYADKLAVSLFRPKAVYNDRATNRMLYGGFHGICSFEEKDFHATLKKKAISVSDRVSVTEVTIDNQSLVKNLQFDARKQILKLNPEDRNIEIYFSSLDFINSSHIRYAYKLEGVDKDWIYLEGREFAAYSNLRKGNYNFYLKSTDENGLWGEKEYVLKVYKLPAFYETWWAYLSYLCLFVFVIYGVLKIISKRVQIRNDLRISQLEQKKLEELTQTKLSYMTNISHDLLTPLTIISCVIDDIETSPQNDSSQHSILRSNVNKLKHLIKQVLDFKKIESGKMQLNVAENDIVMFVKKTCFENFTPLLNRNNITLLFEGTPTEIVGYFDSDKLDRVLFNLLSNACKYTLAKGQILVSVNELSMDDKRYAKIKIQDSGIGIDPEQIEHIFTRFYNTKINKSSETNGIGLSVVKDLVKLHHATIDVISEPKAGTTFTLVIPIDKAFYSDKDFQSYPITSFNNEIISLEGDAMEEEIPIETKEDVKILIVEDNPDLLFTINSILSRRYSTITANNGVVALSILENNEVDIIISDVMMPEMGGLELCKILKKDIATSHIPIIMLTAKNSTSDRVACYEAGANAYISKPFDLKVLSARISNFISSIKKRQKEFKSDLSLDIRTLDYKNIDEKFLNSIINLITEHLADSFFNIEMFSSELNISKSSLYRKIKTMTGFSPSEFVRNIRMKQACALLQDHSLLITDVAYSVGFTDPKYFSTCFKEEFQMTPSEYRNSMHR